MLLNGAALLCLATACSPSSSESNEPLLSQQSDFYNLINVKNVPTQPRNPYVMLNLFADLGSWSGYALPENESGDYAGAFIGPMAMTGRGWVSATMAQPFIQVNGNPTTWLVIYRLANICPDVWCRNSATNNFKLKPNSASFLQEQCWYILQ